MNISQHCFMPQTQYYDGCYYTGATNFTQTQSSGFGSTKWSFKQPTVNRILTYGSAYSTFRPYRSVPSVVSGAQLSYIQTLLPNTIVAFEDGNSYFSIMQSTSQPAPWIYPSIATILWQEYGAVRSRNNPVSYEEDMR